MDTTSDSNGSGDRLSRVEAIAEANAIAISQLREESADFRASFSKLREGQALLTQILVEQRELNAEFRRSTNVALDEFRRSTNAALDRIDLTLGEFRKILDYLLSRDGGNPD